MFKKNLHHRQKDMFSFVDALPETLQNDIREAPESHFYELIFRKIPEERFALLFSDEKSRPNAPINCMVAAFILKERHQWSYEQLFDSIKFNLLTKIALGLTQIGELPFCSASLFNFQQRLKDYWEATGINLLEQVFDVLTDDQLQKLKLKTNIQRCDSTLAASNIRNYSRLQLLVELIIRLHRVLNEADQACFKAQFAPFVKDSSGQYIYKLKGSDLVPEIEKVGQMYHWIYQHLYPQYAEVAIFQTFKRVYIEHFTVVDEKIAVKPPAELTSSSLQSPDDLEATYRHKNSRHSKGQTIHVSETAHPDNQLNLITDVAVCPNNTDDSQILQQRLYRMKTKTPDLDELHQDGGYGSEDNDKICDELGIQVIQTAIKGVQAEVPLEIEAISENGYRVRCPAQTVESTPTRTRFKAEFELTICEQCPHQAACPAILMKNKRVFYFAHADFLSKKRQSAIRKLPKERRCLRNNVEATIREFTCKMPQKKLRVRGAFKTALFAFSVAIGVNFGRIYRYWLANPAEFKRLFSVFRIWVHQIFKERFLIANFLNRFGKNRLMYNKLLILAINS